MLAFRRFGTAASVALRCASRTTRSSPTTRSLSYVQASGLLSIRITQSARCPNTLRYSTSTDPPNSTLPEKPDYLNNAESAIWDKLAAEFSPTELMVQDISGGCGSMYGIEITSEKFRGAGMLKQQRMVNAVLSEEMKNWHGVQLRTKTP